MKRHDFLQRIPFLRAFARAELGMPSAEFDQLEPVEFFRIVEFWEAKEHRRRAADARLRYTIAASAGASAPDGSPLTPAYFLEKKRSKKKAKRKLPSGKELERAFINALPKEWRPK